MDLLFSGRSPYPLVFLWRRAANRWGELLKQAASDEARQYVTERRTACIRKATITREPERD
ncbi:PerC family transcriptional regulator, partial [Escherichia coli]|uniref:PerC family transcriptional regulator n=1 Tax=Escherichia coli TaxID=562 RepID=UPI003EDEBF2B